jgi:murein DD-endopeptidase MepM/ murein hydrolase activator NlpD
MIKVIVCLVTAALFIWPSPDAAARQAGQERKAIKLEPRIYDAYVGQYELTPEFVITVRREENGLSIQATNQPKLEIYAESESKFFLTVVDAQITFVKNDAGEVTHLVLHQNGVDQKAGKIRPSAASAPGRQAAASAPAPRPPIDLPVEMTVTVAPMPVKGDGKSHLAYELHLTSFIPRELTLARLEVISGDGKPLALYEGQELNERLARPGLPPSNSDKQRLGGGMRAVVYIWLSFDTPSAVPTVLRHRLTARLNASSDGPGPSSEMEINGEGAEIKVRTEPSLVLSPPLHGSGWLAANGPSNSSGHRRALIPLGGRAHIAQRFAIDWVQLREDGKTWVGDQLKNESYRAYGAETLAVAEGTVVAVKDGIPENIPGATSRAVPITLETVGGNYVILDLGSGRYAFYAHLQPGSLRVKVGDRVKRGQVLGLLGNSGNSTEPHLHFHVSNSPLPLAAEGLPYVFESFDVQGKGIGWKPSGKDAAEKREMEIPMQNLVVRFPASR